MVDLDEVYERIGSSLLSDVLDGMGVYGRALPPGYASVGGGGKLVGWAATMLMADTFQYERDTFQLQFTAIDALEPGQVIVVRGPGSRRAALWGELLSTAAQVRGARGALVEGLVRDVERIRGMGFPVYARGVCPVSSKGRVLAVDAGCPVEVGGVLVSPGDLVVADADGVVVVPKGLAGEAVERALELEGRESQTREALKGGVGLLETFKRFGAI